MPPSTRLFGTDGGEIFGLPDWLVHAPPEGGLTQWKDGYSAKEQAKAWLRAGTPAVPEEWWSAISPLTGQVDEIYGRPEHLTPLDRYRGPRRHDMLACTRRNGTMVGVIGVEAKACEGFDGSVRDRAKASGRAGSAHAAIFSLGHCLAARSWMKTRAISWTRGSPITAISSGRRRSGRSSRHKNAALTKRSSSSTGFVPAT
jgi:hypothetical protein